MSDSASSLETVSERSSRNRREQRRVSKSIDEHVDKLESCYMRGAIVAEKPDLAGELTFGWTIDAEGHPRGVRLLDDKLGNREIVSCVQAIVDGISFQQPESDSVDVQYPFEFERASNIPHEDWYCRVHRSLEKKWSPPKTLDDKQLQSLARQTIVYARLTDEGAIRQVEFLKRPDHTEFLESLKKLLKSYGPDSKHRLPLPHGNKLREYVRSTGLILQNWRDPPTEETKKEGEKKTSKAEDAKSDEEKSELIFEDCGGDTAAP